MNRKWTIPLLIALTAGSLAFAFTRHAACASPSGFADRLQDISVLRRELQLTDQQAAKIGDLHKALSDRLTECCEKHCAARARLGDALKSGADSAGEADAILAEMCRAYEQSERATVEHIRRVREQLAGDQIAKFDALIASHLGGRCSMPNAGGGSGCKNCE